MQHSFVSLGLCRRQWPPSRPSDPAPGLGGPRLNVFPSACVAGIEDATYPGSNASTAWYDSTRMRAIALNQGWPKLPVQLGPSCANLTDLRGELLSSLSRAASFCACAPPGEWPLAGQSSEDATGARDGEALQ